MQSFFFFPVFSLSLYFLSVFWFSATSAAAKGKLAPCCVVFLYMKDPPYSETIIIRGKLLLSTPELFHRPHAAYS